MSEGYAPLHASPPPMQSPPSYTAATASNNSSFHEAIVHIPPSSSGILVSPPDPSSQPKRPKPKKRVSIDIHVPPDLSPRYAKRLPLSQSSEHVIRMHPHTKDIHGRFKNRKRSSSASRPPSENLETCESETEEEEEDEDCEYEVTDDDKMRKIAERLREERYMDTVRRMSVVINQTRRPSSFHTGFMSKEEKVQLKRKRDRSKDSRSSNSSNKSGFSLLRGQSSKTHLIQSPGVGSVGVRSSSSSGRKSRSSQPMYIPAELLPDKVWARRNVPVDLLDYNKQYGNPHTLILPAFFCILLGMGCLVVAASGISGGISRKFGVFGCGILSVGGILMIMSLCWYYVKSKCLYGDDDLERIRKMSSQVLPMKRMLSFASSK